MISQPRPLPPAAASLLLFGAGGHALVVADAAMLSGWTSLLASDRNAQRCHGELLPGIPLLHAGDAACAGSGIHVCIGDNAAREHEAGQLGRNRLVSVVHPASSVSPLAALDPGCFVAAMAVVAPLAHVGEGVIVNHGAVLDHEVRVGAFSHVAPNASLGGAVRIGRRVLVGAGAVVLPGLSIADDVVVGAGAVVTRSLDAPGLYAGVPARRMQ